MAKPHETRQIETTEGCRGHLYRVILVALMAAPGAYAPLIQADSLMFKELDEAQLEQIRGKFISRGGVQYFGLTMSTHWESPAFNHNVNMNVSVDLSGPTPHIGYSVSGTLGEPATRTESATALADGVLDQTSGTVQSIRAAGNSNRVNNDLAIRVSGTHTGPRAPQNATDLMQAPPVYQNPNGITTVFNSANTPGYSIQHGSNRVTQQLGTNHLMQSVYLQGDTHRIVNHIKMDVGLANGHQIRRSTIDAHHNLLGLR